MHAGEERPASLWTRGAVGAVALFVFVACGASLSAAATRGPAGLSTSAKAGGELDLENAEVKTKEQTVRCTASPPCRLQCAVAAVYSVAGARAARSRSVRGCVWGAGAALARSQNRSMETCANKNVMTARVSICAVGSIEGGRPAGGGAERGDK